MTTKRGVDKNWGQNPRIVYYIYTAVRRLLLSHVAYPKAKVETLLKLPPLDLIKDHGNLSAKPENRGHSNI